MGTKRGTLLVVVSFFMVLLSFSIVTQNGEPAPEGELILAPGFEELYFLEPNDDGGNGCNDNHNSINEPREFVEDCSLPKVGCAVRSLEEDWPDDDDTTCGSIVPGLIITQEYQENLFCGDIGPNYANPNYQSGSGCPHLMYIGDVGDDAANLFKCHNIKSGDDSQYLCSDNHKWRKCFESEKDKVAWVDGILYTCVFNEESEHFEWQKTTGTDLDHDGFTTASGDCDDNPEDDPNPENCPVLEEGSIDCQYPQHSTCAICINPGRPEVCGDGINNDCGGPQAPQQGYKDPIAIQLGPTPDNCHTFREGCEQKSFTDTGHPGDVTSTSTDEDTPDFATIGHTNIYGQPFSWIDLKDGTGYCCGMGETGDGLKAIGDLGKVGEAVDGDYLCLNKNFVGSAPEINQIYWGPKQSKDDSAPPAETGCKGEWCWIPAAGEPAFHVLTEISLRIFSNCCLKMGNSFFATIQTLSMLTPKYT